MQAPNLEDSVDYHFIAFVEREGKIYELDGRKPGPVDCGKIEGSFVLVSEQPAFKKVYHSSCSYSGNFEVAFFSIEGTRELSKDKYELEATAEGACCFELGYL